MASVAIPVVFKTTVQLPALAPPQFERPPVAPETSHFSYVRGTGQEIPASMLAPDELLLVWIQSEPPGKIIDEECGTTLHWRLASATGKYADAKIPCLRVHLQLMCFSRILALFNEVGAKLRAEKLHGACNSVIPNVVGAYLGMRMRWILWYCTVIEKRVCQCPEMRGVPHEVSMETVAFLRHYVHMTYYRLMYQQQKLKGDVMPQLDAAVPLDVRNDRVFSSNLGMPKACYSHAIVHHALEAKKLILDWVPTAVRKYIDGTLAAFKVRMHLYVAWLHVARSDQPNARIAALAACKMTVDTLDREFVPGKYKPDARSHSIVSIANALHYTCTSLLCAGGAQDYYMASSRAHSGEAGGPSVKFSRGSNEPTPSMEAWLAGLDLPEKLHPKEGAPLEKVKSRKPAYTYAFCTDYTAPRRVGKCLLMS